MAVQDVSIHQESRDRYLTYALSVVSGRALPDVRDGLKPVQRRILYAMFQNLGLKPEGGHRKSAAVVGEVLARFHPHGDSACYEAMVRMAQDFSLRYPLVDGQGNFGSLDGDNAAAYRYTEAKLRAIAVDVMGPINEETVTYRPNFDSTMDEPIVLPSRVPNLLINGATGIAVGMATSIPPHNLREVCKALLELSKDPEISIAKLTQSLRGPDFPTGCQILNTKKEIEDIYTTGRGSIRMRGEWEIEEMPRNRQAIVITSIPYAINKSQLVERIANLIIERKVPQLVDVRDESTEVVRVVLELAPGASAEAAVAYLYKNTPLENNFAVNLTVLVPTEGNPNSLRPAQLSLKECLKHFLNFREEVIRKQLEFERKKHLERMHILEGLVIIYDDLDAALQIVRKSDGRSDAAEKLQKRFKLTEVQSFAVVDMRIYQISRTNIEEIRKELKEREKRVAEINKILKSSLELAELVRADIALMAETHGDKRKSSLAKDVVELEFDADAYVVHEDIYAIVTSDGWLKRIRQNNDLAGTRLREGDSILQAHALSTKDSVAFVTDFGSLFMLKAADFPASSGFGTPIQKLFKFRDEEKVVQSFAVYATQPETSSNTEVLKEGDTLLLVSRDGVGFGLQVTELTGIKRNGKRIIKLRDEDRLAAASLFGGKNIAVFTQNGFALSLPISEVPVRDSAAVGVNLIGVKEGDGVVSALCDAQKKVGLTIALSSGRTKEISWSDVTAGHRGLRGAKVISQGEIVSVSLKISDSK